MNRVEEVSKRIAEIPPLLESGNGGEALRILRDIAKPDDPYVLQTRYATLSKRLVKAGIGSMSVLRVALAGDVTLAPLSDLLRFWLMLDGFVLEPYVVPFGTWRQEVLDQASGVYGFRPDIIWIFLTCRDMPFYDPRIDMQEGVQRVDDAIQGISSFLRAIRSNSDATLILNNSDSPVERVFGNLEAFLPESRRNLFLQYNSRLPEVLVPGAILFDLAHLASRFGLARWHDPRLWCHSKQPFHPDAAGTIAFAAARVLAGLKGQAKKCIVLDLDNTLWGGVVGDDGVEGIKLGADGGAVGEAFVFFQQYLKALSERGVALAVCSKNEENLAREAFAKRRDMVLDIEDFSVFVANWEDKHENIKTISAALNIGLDSILFIDDNPAERSLVKEMLPMVAVPDLPDDPCSWPTYIDSQAYFEVATLSAEDRNRSKSYAQNELRGRLMDSSASVDEYLRNLEMRSRWGTASEAQIPRLAQLVNKTNQFHLTTTRYSEAELRRLCDDENWWVGWFSLRDRFGDYGIISLVMLDFGGTCGRIDTWTMSCRVFKRGMEDFVFSILMERARERNVGIVEGKYIPTAKNAVVAPLYSRLGGELVSCSEEAKTFHFCTNTWTSAPPPFIHPE